MRKMKMNTPNNVDFSDYYMPEFGYHGKKDPDFDLGHKLTDEWEISSFRKDLKEIKNIPDTKILAQDFEVLKKENEILNERLAIIENKLSKGHLVGFQNLMFSHDVIDEIWDDDDDTI